MHSQTQFGCHQAMLTVTQNGYGSYRLNKNNHGINHVAIISSDR